MSSATKGKKRETGKRYSAEKKAEVVSFVESFNAENGRGGQSAAVAKFGVSALTISAWAKAANGVSSAKKGPGKRGVGQAKKSSELGKGFTKKLNELSRLATKIAEAEEQIRDLKARFSKLKTNL